MSGKAAKDAMLVDAAEAQRRRGMLPTVREADQYLTQIMEQLDRKNAEAKPLKARPDERPLHERNDKRLAEAKKRAERGGFELLSGWRYDAAAQPLAMGGSMVERKQENAITKRLRARIRLLMSYPDWRDRFKRINPFALQGHAGKTPDEKAHNKRHAAELVRQIIRDSNVTFGPWYKESPRKLWSYDSQPTRG